MSHSPTFPQTLIEPVLMRSYNTAAINEVNSLQLLEFGKYCLGGMSESYDLPFKIMWSFQVNILLNNCKQNMMSLSLLAGRTVEPAKMQTDKHFRKGTNAQHSAHVNHEDSLGICAPGLDIGRRQYYMYKY